MDLGGILVEHGRVIHGSRVNGLEYMTGLDEGRMIHTREPRRTQLILFP